MPGVFVTLCPVRPTYGILQTSETFSPDSLLALTCVNRVYV
jgi:hypothetical protein